jgi:formylglycine-generating enzyme required for sulfatase activity
VKEGSPLFAKFKAKAVGATNGIYGTSYTAKGPSPVLIPEVVKRDSLEIGRFEVTTDQVTAFSIANSQAAKKNSKYAMDGLTWPPLHPIRGSNLPAISVSLEFAESYARWLSELTGQSWRLPYEDEVKDLYGNRDGENTLDYWAGYAPNPEDAAHLREKAKELKGTAPLLKEVGSFRGQGKDDEEPIYDLGGNVAEWVLTRDGKGKVIGGSADCPADPKSNCTPAPEYIGFRVVRGAAKPVPATSPATPQ